MGKMFKIKIQGLISVFTLG